MHNYIHDWQFTGTSCFRTRFFSSTWRRGPKKDRSPFIHIFFGSTCFNNHYIFRNWQGQYKQLNTIQTIYCIIWTVFQIKNFFLNSLFSEFWKNRNYFSTTKFIWRDYLKFARDLQKVWKYSTRWFTNLKFRQSTKYKIILSFCLLRCFLSIACR